MSFQAVILAGGLGTRLRSQLGDIPKVMAPVAGRPFLEHVLAELDRCGFRRVILAVGYRKEAIMDHFGASFRRIALAYSKEDELMGTGGGVRQALRFTEPGLCFVLNGDTWVDLDYAAMLHAHQQHHARFSIAVREVPDVSRFGTVEIQHGHLTGFLEKGRVGPGFINAGVYLLASDIFADVDLPSAFSFEDDFIVPRLATLAPLAFPTAGRFIDIGVPEAYYQAQKVLAASRC